MSDFLDGAGTGIDDKWKSYLASIKGSYVDDNELVFGNTNDFETYSVSSPHFLKYTFTSNSNPDNFGPDVKAVLQPPYATPPDSKNGVFMGLDISKLDLDPTKRQQSVGNIFKAFGIDPKSDKTLKPAVKVFVDILGDIGMMSPVLTRTDNKPTRNGFWIYPSPTDPDNLRVGCRAPILI
jgi:hypothetical protein